MATRDVWRISKPGSLHRLKRETEALEAVPAGHARVAGLTRFGGYATHIDADPRNIGRRFPIAEAPAALRYLQSGSSVGKVVLEV